MHSLTQAASLSCSICAKTFNNRRSQIRHKSYCKNAKSRVTTRKKSCQDCITAKTRCTRDLGQLNCSRCVAKGLICVYEHPSLRGVETGPPSSSLTQSIRSQSPSSNNVQPTVHEEHSFDTHMSRIGAMSALEFEQIIPKDITPFSVRSFSNTRLSLNRNFVLCTLKSYPYMVLPNQDPPPFIHPHLAFGFDKADKEPQTRKYKQGPLQNCVAIVKWHSAKDKDIVRFIWNTINCELDRMLTEAENYNDGDIVAAYNAVAIYFLLRISEDMEEATVYDIKLIKTLIEIAIKVRSRINVQNLSEKEALAWPWERWILAESLRRTVTIMLIIDILFDISSFFPSPECDGKLLVSLPLPCGKRLWKASSSAEWEEAVTRQASQGDDQKSLVYADLMNYQQQEVGILDPWLSEVDDLGTLLMAAASIQPLNEIL